MPPNVTSISQPMDQGVIECFKRRYRRKLLSEILGQLDSEGDTGLIQALKSINLKHVIYMAAEAFDDIPPSTFTKSWRKVWPDVEQIVDAVQQGNPNTQALEPDDNLSMLSDLQRLRTGSVDLDESDVAEWIVSNDDELGNELLNDDEIVQAVINKEGNDDDEDEDDDGEEGGSEGNLSHEEGRAALERAVMYVEQQAAATAVDVMLLRKWRDYAFKNTITQKKQKKITDFF